MEIAARIAQDFRKCRPCMLTKSESCRSVDFENCKQHSMENFLQTYPGILARKSPGCRYRYFLSRFPGQNFRAFFLAVLTTSSGVSKIFAHHRR